MSVQNKKEMTILEKEYFENIVPSFMKDLGIKNVMQVPALEKIVVNMGIGEASKQPNVADEAVMCLSNITGQKPVVTKAKKPISNFAIKAGMPVGCRVTLRSKRMYEFLERLISITIPRVRDFRGISPKSFDGNGNYNLGIKENIVFLEIDRDKIANIRGMDIAICTTSDNDKFAYELLARMGLPFRKPVKN